MSTFRYEKYGALLRKWRTKTNTSMEALTELIFDRSGVRMSVYSIQKLERFGWGSESTIEILKKNLKEVPFKNGKKI